MRKLFKLLSGRLAITCYLILFQLALVFWGFFTFFTDLISFAALTAVMILISLILVVIIINDSSNPSYKIAWIVPILVMPLFGAPLYFIFGKKKLSNRIVNKLVASFTKMAEIIPLNDKIFKEVENLDKNVSKQFSYIYQTANVPLYKGTKTAFLKTGEVFHEALLEELRKAKNFIFLEYFIIEEGVMWDSVLEILKEKAAEGVDVRIIYDDLGTISLLPKDYPKKLARFGIKAHIFNPFHASLDSFLNYRDHRKITVIDGHVGFAGGINLADEYINVVTRFGLWKDSSVLLKGEAVSAITVMFLQLWYYLENTTEEEMDYTSFLCKKRYEDDGYVQPFGDSPISGHLTGELSYMNIINNATKYVYITTPYLVLDNEMITALGLAAKSGIDVRIMTPRIPDKVYVHVVTRSNYPALLKAGVKIYEYKPGFIHSKTVVADDTLGIVGTTNFDFRSFYLHFENGVFMYKSKCVGELKKEYLDMLLVSEDMTYKKYKALPLNKRILGKILRLFSPIM